MAFKLKSPFGLTVPETKLIGEEDSETISQNAPETKKVTKDNSANSLKSSGPEQPKAKDDKKPDEQINADGVKQDESTPDSPKERFDSLIEDSGKNKNDNQELRDRIESSSNPREKARREAKLKNKQRRQNKAADRITAKSEAKENDPLREAKDKKKAKIKEIKAENKNKRRSEKAKTILQKAGIEQEEESPTTYTPSAMDLEDNSDVEGAIKDGMDMAKGAGESPAEYKPNRAGAPLNRNQLQMAPTLKTYKQSHSGATTALQMQSIAMSPDSPAEMNAGFVELPKDVQENILKNDK